MTIKETAGKMLLYFYQLQRTVPLEMRHRQLVFVTRPDGGIIMSSDKKWLAKDLLDISGKSVDALNALMFLRGKKMIYSVERVVVGKRLYVGVQLTDRGIDVIEGVERGQSGQDDFTTMFNIAIDHDLDVDHLVKQQLGSLLR